MLDHTSSSDKPASRAPAVRVNLHGIPADLKATDHWLLWRWSWIGDKYTKVPVELGRHYKTGRVCTFHVPSNEPSCWQAFADVAAAVKITQRADAPFLGAAFRFDASDPFAFIDLDHCRDRQTGTVEPWAINIIRRFHSYTEVSPSGTGIKIIIRGRKPGPRCRAAGSPIELYDSTQFSTITGHQLAVAGLPLPADVEDRQAELVALYGELFPAATVPVRNAPQGEVPPARPSDLSDAWIIDRLSRKPYWHGPNKSEQDLQLANLIAYYVGPDAARVEQILFASPARRPKWKRADYVARTIDRAIEYQAARGFYADRRAERDAELPTDAAEQVEALFDVGRRRRLAREASAAADRGAAQQSAVAAAAVLIASLAEPPSPDQVREDELVRAAAKTAAAAAHRDRPPPCTCGYKRSMYNPATGVFRACHVLCGRWGCSTCGPKRKAQWSTHLRDCITTVPNPAGGATARRPRTDPVYVARVRDDPQTTGRILKHLQRAKGQYARIKYSPGFQLFVATVPLSPRDDAEALSPVEAARRVCETVRGILIFGDTRKPIFTCRAWKLPPRKPAGWTVVGEFAPGTSKSEIRGAMEAELAGQADVRTGSPGLPFMPWVADCALPRPPEEVELTGVELARSFHDRLTRRILGVDPDGPILTDAEIDQLFGVPAGP